MIRHIFFLILFSLFIIPGQSQGDFDFEVSKNLDIYSSVIKQLNQYYVDDIQVGELNKKAIKSMLRQLDPYTNYYAESQIEDVRYMRTGKYGGVGASIHLQKDTIVVGSVLKDYPFYNAGIRAGDKIFAVDNQSVVGKSISDMSEILKGNAGAEIRVKYISGKTGKEKEQEVVRAEIKIKNVPYYGFVGDGIAYIRLSQFTETAASEVKSALKDLSNQKPLKGMVLDLRDNGGGLLQQAVNIMDLFLPPGQLIVETRGKLAVENHSYKTRMKAIYPDLPVVILVNNHSASASEIVAGSFQDLDRGVIMGQKTFGKGLVQKVFPLSYNSQMKITVAKYYIPSGRCIQEINYSVHDKNGKAIHIADSLQGNFRTLGGRPVKDAGGIQPDIILDNPKYNNVIYALAREFLIFNFATQYVNHHDSIKSISDFEISDADFEDFINFISQRSFTYNSSAQKLLDKMKEEEDIKNNEQLMSEVIRLEELLKKQNKQQIRINKEVLKKLITQEIISRYFFDEGKIISALGSDIEMEAVIKLLNDKKAYDTILKP